MKTRIVPVAEVNWLGDEPLTSRDEWHLSVKVRSTRPPREAILRPINDKRAEVELLNPEEGVSGQACVFYDMDRASMRWMDPERLKEDPPRCKPTQRP